MLEELRATGSGWDDGSGGLIRSGVDAVCCGGDDEDCGGWSFGVGEEPAVEVEDGRDDIDEAVEEEGTVKTFELSLARDSVSAMDTARGVRVPSSASFPFPLCE